MPNLAAPPRLPKRDCLYIQPLIISYNNHIALSKTLSRLYSLPFQFQRPIILDNNSRSASRHLIYNLAVYFKCLFIDAPANLGWGSAINYFLDFHWDSIAPNADTAILMVMAHDCLIDALNPDEVSSYFKDPRTIFVCPDYNKSMVNYYSIFRSFHSKPGKKEGLIKIGHQTAFFAKPDLLRATRYDEEFWLYGCEYEIFIRSRQKGYLTFQAVETIVTNPTTDSSSEACQLAYKMNSLYYAYKRHGYPGLYIRSIVILMSALKAYFWGSRSFSRYLASCVAFSITNPGCGHHTYRSNSSLQDRFSIQPLKP